MPPTPFAIKVPDAELDELRRRLGATRWPEPVPGAGWDYGADVDYVRELCAYWSTGYDWRKHERRLNAFPQFISTVDGVAIHYFRLQARGAVRRGPLLLLHGWPGSTASTWSCLRCPGSVLAGSPSSGDGGRPESRRRSMR
jgi:hypothetical protein